MDYTLVTVEKAPGVSVTNRIVELILKNIEEKNLGPGDRLPTERELAARIGVARGTVKSAYKRLEQMNLVRIRQGSGIFVVGDEDLSLKLQRKKAVALLDETIRSLRGLGLEHQEIRRLMDLCLSRQSGQTLQVAILYDNPEMLLDFKKQLSWLPGVALSIFILESITENENPEGLLSSFDLIITPSKHLEAISGLLPNLSGRVMEAAISPCRETLIQITSLPRDSRIGIICRTNVFLAAVKDILLSFGFWEDRIQSFFEMDYTTKTYFPAGIDVLISFADAHIFTNPERTIPLTA